MHFSHARPHGWAPMLNVCSMGSRLSNLVNARFQVQPALTDGDPYMESCQALAIQPAGRELLPLKIETAKILQDIGFKRMPTYISSY